MKLIVGLGNPGRRYEGTRHNVGFAVLAELAQRWGLSRPKGRFQGEVLEGEAEGERLLLLGPLTYMNQSGGSVVAARDFYKLPNEDLLVVCDDLSLPWGSCGFGLVDRRAARRGWPTWCAGWGPRNSPDCGSASAPRPRVGIRPTMFWPDSPPTSFR